MGNPKGIAWLPKDSEQANTQLTILPMFSDYGLFTMSTCTYYIEEALS
jgi:hypothetical protein